MFLVLCFSATPNFRFRRTLRGVPVRHWRVTASSANAAIVSLSREVFNLAVSEANFSVVRPLHRRQGGVLFRVKPLVFKRKILAGRAVLRTRGFHVDCLGA